MSRDFLDHARFELARLRVENQQLRERAEFERWQVHCWSHAAVAAMAITMGTWAVILWNVL